MFRKAIAIAHQFTRPVILSRRTVSGQCGSGMGSFVFINTDGWIVTAAHIFTGLQEALLEAALVKKHRSDEAAIRADVSLNSKQRSMALHNLGKLDQNKTEYCSAWWGADGTLIKDVSLLPEVDLAVGRLESFDPSSVSAYPLFKDPTQGIAQGVSLCKLGYPFHSITPLWDATSGEFSFPPGAMPPPSFPMDGILTRVIAAQTASPPPFPYLWMETSSPGLRGQSGGPTVDEHGGIWAIQSQTAHLPLGFNPPIPGGRPGEVEHQFLNVGRGTHCATILAFLDSLGVKYDVTAY